MVLFRTEFFLILTLCFRFGISFESSNYENQYMFSTLFNEALRYVSELPESQCKTDLSKVYRGVVNQETWALEMLDSWAKPQTGLMTGNIMHIGNYDECLKVDTNDVQGQYCSAMFNPTKGGKYNETTAFLSDIRNEIKQQVGDLGLIKMSFGVCVPKSCTLNVLQNISRITSERFELGIEVQFQEHLCDYNGKREFSQSALIASVIFLIIISLVVFATIYDLLTLENKGRIPVFIAISAYSNSKKICSTRSSDENISCLNGIKFISMFWIVLGHKYLILPHVPYINSNVIKEWVQNPLNMTVVAATFAVDTFFVISGLLVSYTYLKAKSNNIKFNLMYYWLHRLIRLTPSLAALVLFIGTLMQYMGDGPLWNLILKMSQSECKTRWWAILLYVQNYFYPYNSCAPHTWYLAVDTQLYILAPIILIPLIHFPKSTLAFITILTMGSLGGAFAHSWIKDLDLMYYNGSMDFHSFYISTHFRASSWLLGFIMGYAVFKLKEKKVSLNKVLVYSLWFITFVTMSAVIFGHFSFIANPHNRLRSSVFNTFSRPAWCLALCWIIFACSKGYGGVINKFLSHKIFSVCVRITYAMYLLHILQILYTIGTGRLAKYFSNQEELRVIWADFITTMFLAFIWTLLFELPIIGLEKIIFGKKKTNNDETIMENGIPKSNYE